MGQFHDLTGQRFGRLTVIERAPNKTTGKKPCTMWRCLCDCGNESFVKPYSLTSGHTRSCGCTIRKHGYSHKERLYETWKNMRRRCNDPKNKRWEQYGGRGIKVCPEWNDDYMAFRNWAMSNGYTDELTIDRIDVDKGYSPNNCRWATLKEQMNNMTKNKHILFQGKNLTVSQWAEEFGITYSALVHRLERGWSMEKIASTALREVHVKHNSSRVSERVY